MWATGQRCPDIWFDQSVLIWIRPLKLSRMLLPVVLALNRPNDFGHRTKKLYNMIWLVALTDCQWLRLSVKEVLPFEMISRFDRESVNWLTTVLTDGLVLCSLGKLPARMTLWIKQNWPTVQTLEEMLALRTCSRVHEAQHSPLESKPVIQGWDFRANVIALHKLLWARMVPNSIPSDNSRQQT